MRDLDESDLEWTPDPEGLPCAKWQLGRIELRERQLLSALVPALRSAEREDDDLFAAAAPVEPFVPAHGPSVDELEKRLAATRRLTESLVAALGPQPDVADVVLSAINHEYSSARFVRRLRHELGRDDAPEPAGSLVEVDTDVEEPPCFVIRSWDGPARPRRRGREADVVSLEQHRGLRARAALDHGCELVERGEHRQALRAFERSATWQPTADALTYQGWMHSLLGDVERAEQLCLRAIELDPDFGNPYNDLGTICLRRHDADAAIHWFEKAKEAPRYEPRHFPYVNLGRLYLSMGLAERALEEFHGALSLDPSNAEVRQAIQQIRRELRRER